MRRSGDCRQTRRTGTKLLETDFRHGSPACTEAFLKQRKELKNEKMTTRNTNKSTTGQVKKTTNRQTDKLVKSTFPKMNNKENGHSMLDLMKERVHTQNQSNKRTDRENRMCQRRVTNDPQTTKKRTKNLGGKQDKKKLKGNNILCDQKTAEEKKQIVSANGATGLGCLLTGQDKIHDPFACADTNQSQVSTVTFLGRSNGSRGSSMCTVLQNLPENVVLNWREELKYAQTRMRACVMENCFPNFKFCNQKICEKVVLHSLRNCGLKVSAGMNPQQFVEVTSKHKVTTSIFNSARHGIQSNMQKVYQGEFGRTKNSFHGK